MKNKEILIDKYYSYVKIIHKVVLDIYWVVVLVKVCLLTVFLEQMSIVGDNSMVRLGGEAGLPPCHIAGLDWHCHLICKLNKLVRVESLVEPHGA